MSVERQALYARLSERLVDAIVTSDVSKFSSLFATGATFWDNVNREDKSIPEVTERMRLIGSVATAGFESSMMAAFNGGFVQTGVLSFNTADGETADAAVALIVSVDESGRVTRAEEYLDSGAMAPLHRALVSATTAAS